MGLSLLSAGSAATAVAVEWSSTLVEWTSFLKPFLIALSVILLTRSFWVLYVQKRGTLPAKVVTWLSAALVVFFWSWDLFLKG